MLNFLNPPRWQSIYSWDVILPAAILLAPWAWQDMLEEAKLLKETGSVSEEDDEWTAGPP